MRRERALGGRRDETWTNRTRSGRRIRWYPVVAVAETCVRIPPLSAAFPRRSGRTNTQLVARGGSPHAPNVHPIDSEASTDAQEAHFFATRKLSSHRRRLRRPSAPKAASEPRCQEGMDRCVGIAARCRCAPTQSVADRHALSELRSRRPALTMPCAACGRRATVRTSSVVFSPLCPATIEVRGLSRPQSNISNGNGAHSSATAGKR